MKSPVSGKAGSVRLMHLNRPLLIEAEIHGKRLDERSQSRQINGNPPVTTTGLDLVNLYEEHVKGAFLHGNVERVIHANVQFPTELVDGDDAQYMLHHTREFLGAVFGDDSIIADRVDRDEKGRKNVDVFLAPKYIKRNKSGDKVAISTSRDLKELARGYYPAHLEEDKKEDTRPKIQGMALQDAFFDYLSHVMELEGVQRGSYKHFNESDWKSAEQLRLEELEEARIEVEKQRAGLERDRQEVAEQRSRLAAAQSEVEIEKARAVKDREQAAAELEKAREEASRIVRDAQAASEDQKAADLKLRGEMELALANRIISADAAANRAVAEEGTAGKIRQQLEAALAGVPKQRADIDNALAAAQADRVAASTLRAETEEARKSFDAGRLEAKRQERLETEQRLLLQRAADDSAGLNLRASGTTFRMDEAKMTPNEQVAYQSRWSKALVAMARTLALFLEKAREFGRKMKAREEEVDKRTAEVERREREANEGADRLLEDQRKAAEKTAALNAARSSFLDKLNDLKQREAALSAASAKNHHWEHVTDLVTQYPEKFKLTSGGQVSLTEAGAKVVSKDFQARLQDEPPAWAKSILQQQFWLGVARAAAKRKDEQAQQREEEAQKAVQKLYDIVARAKTALTPEEQGVASEAKQAIRRYGMPPEGMGR